MVLAGESWEEVLIGWRGGEEAGLCREKTACMWYQLVLEQVKAQSYPRGWWWSSVTAKLLLPLGRSVNQGKVTLWALAGDIAITPRKGVLEL